MIIAGCAARSTVDAPPPGTTEPPPDAVPKQEPKSLYGNGPYYEVHGKAYEVMESSVGYFKRGVASWYGTEFHGRPTSSREKYDMHAMTAAHKTLPLPTYVRVRNLSNDRSAVVRVNDRGPFIANRIIDLSYAAALKLDMVTDGTTLVEITALTAGDPDLDREVARTSHERASEDGDVNVFVQVGAYGDRENARRRYDMLRDKGIEKLVVYRDNNASPALYRIRIGPLADVAQYDLIVRRLQTIGISDTHLVTD